jgi:hypothetical protein
MALIEAALRTPKEPLQIPYPRNFNGEKSGRETDAEFHISCEPRYLTREELEIAEQFCQKLPYSQAVVKTGAVMIGDDVLLDKDHDYLDEIEKAQSLPSTRYLDGTSERSVPERVLIIREWGYFGNGSKVLDSKSAEKAEKK